MLLYVDSKHQYIRTKSSYYEDFTYIQIQAAIEKVFFVHFRIRNPIYPFL